jgi:hypothetical protein
VAPCLFGVEEELALSGVDGSGVPVPVGSLAGELLALAGSRLRCLSGGGSRLFLANGSLLYVDLGSHPEIATPECQTPWEVVAYLRAGERLVADLAADVGRAARLREVRVAKCNVDYVTRQTWGCHESYLTRRPVKELVRPLVPHLISRVIYTGSGGLHPLSPGLAFSLSPRASHITRVVSEHSTAQRGIFHTKDEPLAGGPFHRLHVIAGDSACSELATWLKVGATALVVALIDAGLDPGGDLLPSDPVAALWSVCADPPCRGGGQGSACPGAPLNAIEIQRAYLQAVSAQVGHGWLPEWAGEVCLRWRQVLDLLESDPGALAVALDWPLKRHLFSDALRSSGHSWDSARAWTAVLERMQGYVGAWPEAARDGLREQDVRNMRAFSHRARSAVDALSTELAAHGLAWAGLDAFQQLRSRLRALDVQFGVLGAGIFAELDRAGRLAHRVTVEDDVRAAMTQPPPGGRARVRGESVSRLAARGGRYLCDWSGITGDDEFLDLTDPFESLERWRPCGPPPGAAWR